jgi:hypothetical protein
MQLRVAAALSWQGYIYEIPSVCRMMLQRTWTRDPIVAKTSVAVILTSDMLTSGEKEVHRHVTADQLLTNLCKVINPHKTQRYALPIF